MRKPPEHGTVSRYTSKYHGPCRCEPCRRAWADYQSAYMKKQRELAHLGRAVLELTNQTRKAPSK